MKKEKMKKVSFKRKQKGGKTKNGKHSKKPH
jgi:hypothetical protein